MDENTTHIKQTVKFGEIELALIDQGIAELDRGEGMTFQQAREFARKRTQEWMETIHASATV